MTRRLDPADAAARLALAHALRTPLTALTLGVGLLRPEAGLGALNDAQREVVRTLGDELARLQALVDRALRTDPFGAYTGPVERTPMALAPLVRRALAPLAAQARERDVRVVARLAGRVRAVVDPVKLSWVVASLAGNALRYSPRGGTVAVALGAADGAAELCVTDEGPGLAWPMLEHVFDRAAGRGWTLVLVREITEAHGGEVRADAAPGRGSRFTVRLPLAAPAARRPAKRVHR